MIWNNAETNQPDDDREVLVSDDMLESNTGDRWCHISLTDAVKFWAEIEPIK